jgi:hypothetical protein
MKIQDGLLIVILGVALLIRKPAILAVLGLFFLLVAIPLYDKWIFFTAERLVMYAAVCFLFSIFLSLKRQS